MARFNLRKFIKVAVVVTLILAVVEVAVIFILSDKKDKAALRRIADSTKNHNRNSAVDSSKPQEAASTGSSYGATPATSSYAQDTTANQKSDVVSTPEIPATSYNSTPPPIVNTSKADTTVKHIAKPVVKAPLKQLSSADMQQVLDKVNAERTRNGITAKCVQLRKAKNCNVNNAFKAAAFLQNYGFTIAGRFSTPTTQTGIDAYAEGDCVVVTIGSM